MDLIEVGNLKARHTTTGKVSGYVVIVQHTGLGESKDIFAKDIDVLEAKIQNSIIDLEAKWEKHLQKLEKESIAQEKAEKVERARQLTQEAEEILSSFDQILTHTLDIDDAVDWETLKDKSLFKSQCLQKNGALVVYHPDSNEPLSVLKPTIVAPPVREDYVKKVPLWKLVLGLKNKTLKKYEENFSNAKAAYKKVSETHQKELTRRSDFLTAQKQKWEQERQNFLSKQKNHNSKVDRLKNAYESGEEEAVLEHFDIVLSSSQYHESFPKNFELQYTPNNKILLIDYELPPLEKIPTLKTISYVKSKDEFVEKHISSSQLNKTYDNIIYQICLRTLHEIYEADTANTVNTVNLNGIVDSIDEATGIRKRKCIASIQVSKDEFAQLNLAHVSPKACFKALKGVSSAKLSTLTPIKPILSLNKTDDRLVDHYDVAENIDHSTNLAAMNWQDFEHLIRELFEKEFATSGGEVKVTQASSDGGVDAIAFDPDPIRGGKTVIQAKRYTNTVGVAAVRDLYGTVMNEGANKGILVTTSDYGADSHKFALDKPITLLNGANLLHLLAEHGHKAKIDIQEAKSMLIK